MLVSLTGLRHRLLLGALLVCTAQVACGDDAEQRVVAARVEGRPIYAAEVDRTVKRVVGERKLPGDALAELQARTLEQLISREAILLYLEKIGMAASQQDVALELARIEKQLQQQAITLPQYLAEGSFLDEQDLRETLAWQVSWERYLGRMTTDDNLEKHFDRHRAEFDGTQLEVAHLLLKVEPRDSAAALDRTLELARAVREQILAGGTTFADQARQRSIAPTAADGGRIARISRHGSLPEPVSAAAFQLQKGEISEPVVSTFGVHLIQCLEITPGQQPFAAVRDQVAADARRFLFDWVAKQQRPTCQIEYTGATPHLKPGTEDIVTP